MQETFIKMVLEQFQFLVDEFEFQVIKVADSFQYDARAEGYVEYQSPTTFVTVTGDWYWNGVTFGRAKDDGKFAISSEQVYQFQSLTPEDRAMLCSHDPKTKRSAALWVAAHRLQHEKKQYSDRIEEIKDQLGNHARWLRQYARPFLLGDFSLWFEIFDYKLQRTIAEHKRAGRREEVLRYVGSDANGKAIHVKEYVLQSSLDYLARLREGT